MKICFLLPRFLWHMLYGIHKWGSVLLHNGYITYNFYCNIHILIFVWTWDKPYGLQSFFNQRVSHFSWRKDFVLFTCLLLCRFECFSFINPFVASEISCMTKWELTSLFPPLFLMTFLDNLVLYFTYKMKKSFFPPC